MFTGIVEEVGTVDAFDGERLQIKARQVTEDLSLGDSVSVNGACLTAVALHRGAFSVELSPETLRRTNLGEGGPGSPVNLERSLLFNGRVGGHLVQGHVDGTGKILSMTSEGDAVVVRFSAPSEVLRYIVQKGFIAVDGVSLTVMSLDDESFSVSLVRYTLDHTVFGGKAPGDMANLEIDILAKYAERLLNGERDGSLAEIGGGDDAAR